MTDIDDRRLDRGFERIERGLPPRPARWLRRVRKPDARLIRIPIGVLLVLGGVFSFLPVLGLWMLPLGLLLIALDVAFLKRPVGRVLVWGMRRITEWRRTNRFGLFRPPPPGRRSGSEGDRS